MIVLYLEYLALQFVHERKIGLRLVSEAGGVTRCLISRPWRYVERYAALCCMILALFVANVSFFICFIIAGPKAVLARPSLCPLSSDVAVLWRV